MSLFNSEIFKQNMHTHTQLCKHATGDVMDYCLAAIDNGIEVLGISDHTPLPDGRWDAVRMSEHQLPGYAESVETARDKLAGKLKVISALECDYIPEYLDYYKQVLLGEYGFEYLIGAMHYFKRDGEWKNCYGDIDSKSAMRDYTKTCVEMLHNNDIFAFAAHPDLFANCWLEWDSYTIDCAREILKTAEKTGMPLELNGYGTQKKPVNTPAGKRWQYPLRQFWELAREYDIRVIINSDAHSPDNITGGMAECLELAIELGLQRMPPYCQYA